MYFASLLFIYFYTHLIIYYKYLQERGGRPRSGRGRGRGAGAEGAAAAAAPAAAPVSA